MIIPRSTYRFQLHAQFGFQAATAALPYLATLGISHVYCSPIWRARPGSTHGYDVVDHSRISDELGGEAAFRDFAAQARSLGMGLLLDIVPNHMGVFGSENPWWLDVLENGQASEYADFFDIDWYPPNPALHFKLLVPVLGDHYGSVLDAGDLRLTFDAAGGALAFDYSEHRFPLDPSTYPRVLAGVVELPEVLLDGYANLPSRDDCDEESRAVRRADARGLQTQLAEIATDADVAAAIERRLAAINDEASRDALSDLHDAQAYRLAYWRVASGEINYRRFFDVNTLAAVRIEDERVFEATQSLALDLAAEGIADGLRVDHSDGLLDPAQYFERLQAGYQRRIAERRDAGAAAEQTVGDAAAHSRTPLYVLTEKIVGEDEQVPLDWAIAGTTGYEFAALLNGVFVERTNADRLDRIWRDFSQQPATYASTVRLCKQRVARRALGAELTVLANALQHITLQDRRTRDYTLDDIRGAIASVAACMPVYRTYVAGSVSPQDTRFVDGAIRMARRHTEVIDTTIFDVIGECLLTPAPGDGEDAKPIDALRNRFAMRFQQFASPVAAKGVEDTAFYRYHRLISLNEVGGSPAVFGVSAADFHAANAERLAHWPHTMLASSTHDNKRSEDVRYRLDVLSEQPARLRLGVRRFLAAVDRWRSEVDGEAAPANHDLYLLYQTLVGSLPAAGFGLGELATYRERIHAYLEKALREAKQETSWDTPNADYEQALKQVVDRVLDDRGAANPLLEELLERAADLAWLGALNSASATLLKLTVPGVPDTYQGTDLIDLSLVDPDNRRPVDYALRQTLLDGFAAGSVDPAELAAAAQDGRFKLWCLWKLLNLRNAHPALFANGSYQPLRIRGHLRNHVIAFSRQSGDATLLVVASRKLAGMKLGRGVLPVGAVWADTHLRPPARGTAVDVLSGQSLQWAGDMLPLQDALSTLPIAAILIRGRSR